MKSEGQIPEQLLLNKCEFKKSWPLNPLHNTPRKSNNKFMILKTIFE